MSTIETIQDGYPGLARLMGPNFDQGFGIFKKFSQLNAQNLLYMQAELLGLEHELNITTHFDDKEAATMTFARSVWDMRRAEYSTQWAKILEIREKLQVYNRCLLEQTKIAKMDKANKHDLRLLIRWLVHQEGGRGFLDGIEYEVWDEKLIEDLVELPRTDSCGGFKNIYFPGFLVEFSTSGV
ncbi:hypothetical protein N0V94_003518 [Neodidymelliopsis sp. IMI 364377]|nr:hypothetical protein N0V94_003518 [Neodidymelliopsis sp. IMI 364377]